MLHGLFVALTAGIVLLQFPFTGFFPNIGLVLVCVGLESSHILASQCDSAMDLPRRPTLFRVKRWAHAAPIDSDSNDILLGTTSPSEVEETFSLVGDSVDHESISISGVAPPFVAPVLKHGSMAKPWDVQLVNRWSGTALASGYRPSYPRIGAATVCGLPPPPVKRKSGILGDITGDDPLPAPIPRAVCIYRVLATCRSCPKLCPYWFQSLRYRGQHCQVCHLVLLPPALVH